MATREELRAALDDYVEQARKSERVTRSLRNWNCTIYIETTDIDANFTMRIQDAQISVHDGLYQEQAPDLVIRGNSEDLTDIFWCDANPASNYLQGAIKIQGSSDDVIRLDALSLLIYQELSKI